MENDSRSAALTEVVEDDMMDEYRPVKLGLGRNRDFAGLPKMLMPYKKHRGRRMPDADSLTRSCLMTMIAS